MPGKLNFLTLIERKRDGERLTAGELAQIVRAYAADQIPDYQMAAFLMAVYFSGLNADETRALTLAMRDSGVTLQFPKDTRPLVDKHSTGGVGDKVSLPLAPLLACLGFRVPMISGRGLGITGGTLDKLDSIPGLKTLLPTERIVEIVQTVGCVICGQTDQMVPADKKLYALRDVTGTVPSIPLIVASIMSKKLAERISALVLDVKFGRAAFMQTMTDARKLAKAMVTLGNQCGVNTRAILTDMNTPLGRTAGNWLEVKESVELLNHRTVKPNQRFNDSTVQRFNDLRTLVLTCAAHLLVQTGRARSFAAAYKQAEDCLNSVAPRKKWDEMLVAQGADLDAFNEKLAHDYTAPVVLELKAKHDGFVSRCDARVIGEVIRDLGGGRLTKETKINFDVGVDRLAKPGDKVQPGSTLCRIHAVTLADADAAAKRLETAFAISRSAPRPSRLIAEVITR